jgi:hypothetical protein
VSDAPFLFDDFFVDESDPGVEILVELKGRQVPIRVRRSITLTQKEAAMQGAIQRHITDEGRVVVDGMDDALLSIGVLFAYLVAWPFTRRDGSPVPITREAVAALDSNFIETALMALRAKQAAREVEADGPFVPPSGVASEAPAPVASASLPAASDSVSPATSDSAGNLTQ